MTLRRRLVAALVLLVAVGLGVAAVVSYQLFRHSEFSRVDQQLSAAAPQFANILSGYGPGGGALSPLLGGPGGNGQEGSTGHGSSGQGSAGAVPHGPEGGGLPQGSFAELRNASGAVVGAPRSLCDLATSCPQPALPANLTAGASGQRSLTVGATSGSTSFRVYVTDLGAKGAPTGTTLIVAEPVNGLTSALHGLFLLELAVSGAVLLAVSLAAVVIIRRGLRPLERMAVTARAIAGGELSRRVSPADDRSEVGQLGLALNTMLSDIEGAFAQREATEQRLRRFLADASHELRTPLTSIRGYAELWRMGAASSGEDLATAMRRIEEHAARMGVMVEELLMLARLDQVRPAERAPVDLAVIAADACSDLAAASVEHPLTLDAPAPVPVVGDQAHLRQAVANLLANAARHTPPHTRIDVGARVSGGVATLSVRDHGPGLTPEGLARAFDRFWQADPSRHGGGAGLGLAIVAGVAAEHGGQVVASNAPGGGALFELRLPVPAPRGPSAEAAVAASSRRIGATPE